MSQADWPALYSQFFTNTTYMDRPLPLPSHIHYELLLQLLERKTSLAVYQQSPQQEQVHELIITLRKALSQQKQLESVCQNEEIPIEYYWSLNEKTMPPMP